MARLTEIYLKYCPDVPIRPDHVPTIEGDANDSYGYTMRGKLFAAGYIKGLIDGIQHKPSFPRSLPPDSDREG
jgi:mannonate dehydratase